MRAEMLPEQRIETSQRDPDIACLLQFVLPCAYRFGVRLNEARGLRRRVWCESKANWAFNIRKRNPFEH